MPASGSRCIKGSCGANGSLAANGWGAEVAALMADEAFVWLDAPIKRVAAPDVPPPFAPVLEQNYVPSVARVVETTRSLF